MLVGSGLCWSLTGVSGLSRSGHESASRRFNPADVEVDVAGRSFLVTGANSGIGKATAKEIARRGEPGCLRSSEGSEWRRWKDVSLAFRCAHKGAAPRGEGSGALSCRVRGLSMNSENWNNETEVVERICKVFLKCAFTKTICDSGAYDVGDRSRSVYG